MDIETNDQTDRYYYSTTVKMADGATLFGDAAEITFKIFNRSKIGFIFFERIQG